jgi:hypothetical protein
VVDGELWTNGREFTRTARTGGVPDDHEHPPQPCARACVVALWH